MALDPGLRQLCRIGRQRRLGPILTRDTLYPTPVSAVLNKG